MTEKPDDSDVFEVTITWEEEERRWTAGLQPNRKGIPLQVESGLTSITLLVYSEWAAMQGMLNLGGEESW